MLTHIQIASAKPSAKPYNLSDSQGLYLSVRPNGSKLWRLSYRYLGKQKTFHIGPWPDVSLAEARTRRDEIRKQITAGLDPAQEKKRARVAAELAADNTFKTIAEEWVAKSEREGRAPVTMDKIRWLLGMAYPMIGKLPVSEISPQRGPSGSAQAGSDGKI